MFNLNSLVIQTKKCILLSFLRKSGYIRMLYKNILQSFTAYNNSHAESKRTFMFITSQ